MRNAKVQVALQVHDGMSGITTGVFESKQDLFSLVLLCQFGDAILKFQRYGHFIR